MMQDDEGTQPAASHSPEEAESPGTTDSQQALHPQETEASHPEPPASQSLPRFVLPSPVPAILRLTDRRVAAIAAVGGILLGSALSVLAYLVGPAGSALGQIFDLERASSAIPVAIACMLCWGIFLCVLRWRRIRAIDRFSSHMLLLDASRVLSALGPTALAEQLNVPESRVSPLARRLQALLRQWSFKRSVQDADLVLQQHDVHDQETVQSGYQTIRVFVWAMPVLGLIGTVIGISAAVGGFAAFLAGNVDDVAVIKESLVGVTSGLSFAFLITMEGLLGALVLMLPGTALQSREERQYARLQHAINETFFPTLQIVAPVVEPEMAPQFRMDTDALVQTARDMWAKTLSVWEEQLARFAEGALARVSVACERMAVDGAGAIAREGESAAAALDRTIRQSAAQFEPLIEQQRTFAAQQTQLLQAQSQLHLAIADANGAANDRASALLSETITRFGEAGQTVGHHFQEVYAHETAALRDVIATLEDRRQALHAALDAHALGFTNAVDRWRQEGPRVDSYFSALRELGGDLQRVAELQEKLHGDVRELNAAGPLIRALQDVSRALVKVEPFLQTLSGSFHFVAVPTAVPGHAIE